MGEFRFRIPKCWKLEPGIIRTVHVIGLDGIPKPCSVKVDGQLLIISRNQNESGRTYIAYPFSRRGELTICTGTLPESDQPYNLATELARGTVNRLRSQTSIWHEGGLDIPGQVWQLTKSATESLAQSIMDGNTDPDSAAYESLNQAIEAIFVLSEQFGDQIAEYRVSHDEIPAFWLAVSHSTGAFDDDSLDGLFDLIETQSGCHHESSASKTILGPLLDASPLASFSAGNLDFKTRRDQLLERCREELKDMPAGTSLIHAACGLNGTGHRRLGYRQQVQLTTDILNLIDDSDSEQPVMVSFDNPWAERLARSVGGIHPLQIADDLMRNGTRISFIGLDINLDYWPNGSLSRDPLQWIDVLDIWCQFGLPLVLCLRVPQSNTTGSDKNADVELKNRHAENVTIQIDHGQSATEVTTELEKPIVANSVAENLTSDQRLSLIRTILPMAVARPGVHGIIWRQWSDIDDPRFPLAGLTSDDGKLKPIGSMLVEYRQRVLDR